jgi:hypothetical protein
MTRYVFALLPALCVAVMLGLMAGLLLAGAFSPAETSPPPVAKQAPVTFSHAGCTLYIDPATYQCPDGHVWQNIGPATSGAWVPSG